MRRTLFALLLAFLPGFAAAEALFLDLSTHRIEITSNFVGQDLTLFGTIVTDRGAPPQGDYGLIALVRGPDRAMALRRKAPLSGLWISREAARLPAIPSSLFRLSSAPPESIAPPDALRSLGLDMPSALKARALARDDPESFAALMRLMQAQGLLRDDSAIDFAAPSLFRATLPLPGSLPVGAYTVDLYLFSAQHFIGSGHSGFVVEKSGFSADLARLSQDRPLLYGLGTALIALFFGWFAAIIFRRD